MHFFLVFSFIYLSVFTLFSPSAKYFFNIVLGQKIKKQPRSGIPPKTRLLFKSMQKLLSTILKYRFLPNGKLFPLAKSVWLQNQSAFCCFECRKLYRVLQKLGTPKKLSYPLETLLEILNFLEKNEDRYRTLAILGRADRLISMLQRLFTEYMENNVSISEEIRNSPAFKVRAHFFAAGIADTYIAYFRGELDLSLKQLAEILSEMIINNSLLF